MKPTISRIAMTASILCSLFIASCGKKDTAASLADEMATQMSELITVLESAKDKESAEKAVAKIDKVGDEIVSIAGRLDALGEPSDEDVKVFKEKMDTAQEENEKKMMAAGMKLQANEEVGKLLEKAMTDFGEKMKSIESTMKKFGQD